MNNDDCHHEHTKKIKYLRSALSGVHGPYSEVWLVQCEDCDAEFEETYPAD